MSADAVMGERDRAEKARLRAARNRAAKRRPTKKARCIEFLRKVLACGPVPVERVLRLAVSDGLEKPGSVVVCCKPMRAAYEALGVVRGKKSMNGGWWWDLPDGDGVQLRQRAAGLVMACGLKDTVARFVAEPTTTTDGER